MALEDAQQTVSWSARKEPDVYGSNLRTRPFPDELARTFVFPESEKDRLTQTIISRPLSASSILQSVNCEDPGR
jgi:hypothetical protein